MEQKKMSEKIREITGINPRKCMKCGKCSATCPAYEEMEYHPHQFVAMIERDAIEELMESKAIWNCLSCMACVERCPRGVEPGKLVEAARQLVTRQQGGNYLLPDDIPARLDGDLPQQALVSALRKFTR
ncbi:MAG: 4Fe-4S dicluster domain-containing protein [Oscillospiraceae bacterium]|jgi:heterodisulfide reductase subunit C|nr:4Fe-4S dicluster domain-containing protein [Oscillospiraceae bacterium]